MIHMYGFGQYWPWMKLLNNIVYYIVFVFKSLFSRARGIKLSMNNGKNIFSSRKAIREGIKNKNNIRLKLFLQDHIFLI